MFRSRLQIRHHVVEPAMLGELAVRELGGRGVDGAGDGSADRLRETPGGRDLVGERQVEVVEPVSAPHLRRVEREDRPVGHVRCVEARDGRAVVDAHGGSRPERETRRERAVEGAVVGLVLLLQRFVVVSAQVEVEGRPVGVATEKAQLEVRVGAGEGRRMTADDGDVRIVLRLVGVGVVALDDGCARDDVGIGEGRQSPHEGRALARET